MDDFGSVMAKVSPNSLDHIALRIRIIDHQLIMLDLTSHDK